RSIENFPMQANGAEMLRLACCLATERGVKVAAPVHDAILISGSEDEIDEKIAVAREAMREASRVVLRDMELSTDIKVIRDLERYTDPRGTAMWGRIARILGHNWLEKCA